MKRNFSIDFIYRLLFLDSSYVFVFFFYVLRPDGEKKAYVRLAPDYDALDVANKVSLGHLT